MLAEKFVFLLTKGEDVIHNTVKKSKMRFVALQKTCRAPVPEAIVESVDGLRCNFETGTGDGVRSVGQRSDFTPVVSVSNTRGHEMEIGRASCRERV